jgi:hypothetical protein
VICGHSSRGSSFSLSLSLLPKFIKVQHSSLSCSVAIIAVQGGQVVFLCLPLATLNATHTNPVLPSQKSPILHLYVYPAYRTHIILPPPHMLMFVCTSVQRPLHDAQKLGSSQGGREGEVKSKARLTWHQAGSKTGEHAYKLLMLMLPV